LRLAVDGHLSIARPELEVRDTKMALADHASPNVVGGAISLELLLALR
jgi:hypothetical protein